MSYEEARENAMLLAPDNEARSYAMLVILAADKEITQLQAQVKVLEEALTRIKTAEDAPEIDITGEWETGLHCGVEDRDCQDRYDGANYGYAQGVERTIEWAVNEATFGLEALKDKTND